MSNNTHWLLQINELRLREKDEFSSPSNDVGKGSLKQRINGLRHLLPAEILAQYDELTTQHNNPVATISNCVCQGCGKQLSAKLCHSLIRKKQLIRCEYCGRFLVAEAAVPKALSLRREAN